MFVSANQISRFLSEAGWDSTCDLESPFCSGLPMRRWALWLMKVITMYINVILYDSLNQTLPDCAELWYLWFSGKSYTCIYFIFWYFTKCCVFMTKVKTSEITWQKFYSISSRTFWSPLVLHARTRNLLALLLKNHNSHGPSSFRPTNQEARLSNIYLTEFFCEIKHLFCGTGNVAQSRIASTVYVLSMLMLVGNTCYRPKVSGIETACMPVRGSCIKVFLKLIGFYIDNKFTAFTVLNCTTILLLFQTLLLLIVLQLLLSRATRCALYRCGNLPISLALYVTPALFIPSLSISNFWHMIMQRN